MTTDFVAAIEAPISGSNPAGTDVTYDDDFQRLKAAVDSIGSIRADGVDYSLIVELGRKVLTQKSKDVRVAVFLAFGLERMRGISGIADGVAAVDVVVRTYWDGMYPPLARMVGRQNALQSLSDRLKESVAALKPAADDRPHLERALEHVKSLQEFSLAAMQEKAPALSGLAQALEEALRRTPAVSARDEAAEAQPAAVATPVDGRTSPVQKAASGPAPTAGIATATDASNLVIRAVDFLRQEDPANPVPYRLVRALRWSNIAERLPNENGRTLIPAPPAQRIEFLQRLSAEGKHERVVVEAEDTFHEFPFLLDAQRFVAQGMDALPGYSLARDAVIEELALLLRRVDQLPGLTFDDGTPMAGGPTRAWIEASVLPVLGGSSADASVPGSAASALDEHFQKAREQLGKGDFARALATIQHEGGPDASGKARFERKLFAARLSISAGKHALARSLLETLSSEIDGRDLSEWEPVLTLEVWANLYLSLEELVRAADAAEKPDLKRRQEQVLERICGLDPGRALAVLGKS